MRRLSSVLLGCSAVIASVSSANATLVISSAPTSNVTCSAGTCTATSNNAVLNATDLLTMLATTDVTVQSDKVKDIDVQSALFWASAQRLSLIARRNIVIAQSIQVTGSGGLSLSGAVSLASGVRISFLSTSDYLSINNHTYTLVNNLTPLLGRIGGYYALADNYDAVADGVYPSAPITALNGALEGLGNTISNLSISDATPNDTNGVGLVGFVDSGSEVRNLHLSNAQVTGNYGALIGALVGTNAGKVLDSSSSGQVTALAQPSGAFTMVGGLVGGNADSATIDGCSSSATVSGGLNDGGVGGLVGYSLAAVSNSSASGSVTSAGGAGTMAGGLVGYQATGVISTSRASGAVSGAQYDGGVAGYGDGGYRLGASGNVTGGAGASIGGLYGDLNEGVVSESFASGQVTSTGAALVGGLVGENHGDVEATYSVSPVTGVGKSDVGGLVGLNTNTVTYSYAAGHVGGAAHLRTGGLIGVDNSGTLLFDYWDLTTTGIKDTSRGVGNVAGASNVTGLTDKQLRAALPAGFDTALWAQKKSVNNGLPYLANAPPQ